MCRLHPEVSFQEDEAMQLTHGQRSIGDDLNPDFYAGRKLGEMEQALLWSLLQAEPECPSRVLLDKAAQRQIVIAVSLRHVNRWRAAWGLNRRQGRPGHADGYRPVASGAEVVRVTPYVACVGVHMCLPIGSTNRMPSPRWWPTSRRRHKPISRGTRTMTLPCYIIASRHSYTAFRRCFRRPCWVSTVSASLIPASIHCRR